MVEVLEDIATVDCAEAFGRFDSQDTVTLRRYSTLCREIAENEVLRGGIRFNVKVGPDESYEKLDYEGGPHALRALMGDIRQLWAPKDRTHFPKLRNTLRRNAETRGTAEAAAAVRHLDDIGKAYSEALRDPMMGFYDPAEPGVVIPGVPASQVVEDWLYSGAMHWDEEKAARVAAWSREGYEFTLVKAILPMCRAYWQMDVFVQGILEEPSLLTGPAESAGWSRWRYRAGP